MDVVILAGGSGAGLYLPTAVTSKQLLPIHDSPSPCRAKHASTGRLRPWHDALADYMGNLDKLRD